MILYEIEQKFNNQKVEDIKSVVWKAVQNNEKVRSLKQGSEVAITAGSRGIDNIVVILKEVVSCLKSMGFQPFLVPAMGSHGGATAEGQIEILHHLGITEESVGAPIRSSMETLLIGKTPDGLPVYMDRHAFHADGIIVVNRIKAHTAFRGKIESGLSKMVTIGLGKQKGAHFVHSQGPEHMEYNIVQVSKYALKHAPICMGIAIVENGYDQTAIIEGVDVEEWYEKEAQLLEVAKKMMPMLPLDEIDVLVVEEMGKDYSGTGMDPNVIGRWRIDGVPEPAKPMIHRIVVLDLSPRSGGNANGIGLADFTTDQLIEKIDKQATYMNALTTGFLRRMMFPLHFSTEQETIETAIQSLGPDIDVERMIYVQIPNTLHLNRLYVSKAALQTMDELNKKYNVLREFPLAFDEQGRLRVKKSHIHASKK